MASTVYFAGLRARKPGENIPAKVGNLFDEAGFSDCIETDDLTAIKLHFGEEGNTTYINPVFVRKIVDKVQSCGGRPFLTDTNTLYTGSRHNAVEHLRTAIAHGFDFAVTGAPLIIADGLDGGHYREVSVEKKHFRTVKIAGDILAAKSMIVMTHFKGHGLAGFGGAIKNLAMGCAPIPGKMAQHAGLQPVVDGAVCVYCGECVTVCPAGAISRDGEASIISRETCIGCGECTMVCPASALDYDWDHDGPVFLEMMAEYAFGAVSNKSGKVGYITFLTHVTPDCDCVPWSDAPIVPDIGILASRDPVALDRACFDFVNQQQGLADSLLVSHHHPGENKFSGVWRTIRAEHQLDYAEKIGLGTENYELVTIG